MIPQWLLDRLTYGPPDPHLATVMHVAPVGPTRIEAGTGARLARVWRYTLPATGAWFDVRAARTARRLARERAALAASGTGGR